MKHLLQKNSYGCGLYALSNALNDHSLVTEDRLEQSKKGNTIAQLNEWIKDHDKDYEITCLYFNILGNELPKELREITLTKKDGSYSQPLFFDVQKTENSKCHFIAAELFANGSLLVFDSLIEDPFLSGFESIHDFYHRVFGVWGISSRETNEWVVRTQNKP